MPCTLVPQPIRARRMSFALGVEQTYAELSKDVQLLTLYNVDSLINPAFDSISGAEVDASTTETLPDNGTWDLKGSVYVYGSGTPGTPPKWMQLLEGCGFTHDTSHHYPYARYISTRSTKSLSLIGWREKLKHVALGCRGTFTITGTYAQPVELAFAMRGLYKDRTEEVCTYANVPVVLPPRLVDSHFTVFQGTTNRTSPCKAFSISSGGSITVHPGYTQDGNPSEILLPIPLDPTWEITVEVKHGFDWTEIYRNKKQCSLSITVGQDAGSEITFRTPMSNAKLASPPTYGNSNGVLIQTARFQLLGKEYLEIVHA